jgi:Regulator of chromosome condensation (RCC1) repeat
MRRGLNLRTPRLLLALAPMLGGYLLLTACGGGSAPPDMPASMTIVAGNNQTGTVGTALPTTPAVQVLDAAGKPVSGVLVTFAVFEGGSIANVSATTNAQGLASAGTWILGPEASNQFLAASIPAAAAVSAANFMATATAGVAATLTALGMSGQVILPNGQVVQLPFVLVSDSYGNPVAGESVTFSVTTGGGSVVGASATSTTSGIATVGGWTLGSTPGNNTLTASASGLASVEFSAIAATELTFDSVVAGYATTCGLSGGIAYCWGGAPGAEPSRSSGIYIYPQVPTVVAGGLSFQRIFVGDSGTFCGLTVNGAIYCWGSNGETYVLETGNAPSVGGFLGTGSDALFVSITPQQVGIAQTNAGSAAPVAGYVGMYVGDDHSCAIGTDGNTYCWGSCSACGVPAAAGSFDVPTLVAGASGFTAVATSGYLFDFQTPRDFSCGLTTAGEVDCWGTGFGDALHPTSVVSGIALSSFSQRDVFALPLYGAFNACGLTASGEAYCWGDNSYGEAGTGSLGGAPSLAPVMGGLTFTSISAGSTHSCALTAAGAAYCWGDNSAGEIGDGTTTQRLQPTPVSSPSGVLFTQISAGVGYTCALAQGGAAYCWGSNGAGNLGNNTAVSSALPARVVP